MALAVGKRFKGLAALALTDLGEMEVAHDFLERAVTEVGGDLSNRSAAFEHVGAITVAQRINTLLINSIWRGSPTGSIHFLAVKFR